MSVKRNFLIGILDDTKIYEVHEAVAKCATVSMDYSGYMFFSKQPLHEDKVDPDIVLFQLECRDEKSLEKRLNELIDVLNGLDTHYVLRGDDESREYIVTLDYAAKLFISFDNLDVIPKGTFNKIDELKMLKSEFGFCKGFKPNFRPIEGNPIGNLNLNPEVIYLISDSDENLSKLNDYVSKKALEVNKDFILDLNIFKLE